MRVLGHGIDANYSVPPMPLLPLVRHTFTGRTIEIPVVRLGRPTAAPDIPFIHGKITITGGGIE